MLIPQARAHMLIPAAHSLMSIPAVLRAQWQTRVHHTLITRLRPVLPLNSVRHQALMIPVRAAVRIWTPTRVLLLCQAAAHMSIPAPVLPLNPVRHQAISALMTPVLQAAMSIRAVVRIWTPIPVLLLCQAAAHMWIPAPVQVLITVLTTARHPLALFPPRLDQ